MSDTNRAVFLSYASQDSEAAKKICDALRAAGVEVWFDRSELRGGDAWDQKIRKQIKECALFVPVISANTQARLEGYFRLEWKLAEDRSHLMARGKPFIVPVCVDDTKDWDAIVPDSFTTVQWTRLAGGAADERFSEQVKKLLAGEAPSAVRPQMESSEGSRRPRKSMGRRLVALALVLIFGVGLPVWKRMHPTERAPVPAVRASGSPAAPISEARQLIARAGAMTFGKYDSTAEDYAAAEVMVKRALELDPNDANVWAFSSQLNFSFGSRGFDHAPTRIATAKSHAERALALAPDSIDALYALARWQRDYEEAAIAEATFKKILAREPGHVGALGGLAWIYDRVDRMDEAIALYERIATLPGVNHALNRYTEYLAYFHRARFDEAERCIRQSIAIEPSANSQAALALLLLTAKGDADGAARVLASGPTADRSEPRTIWTTALVQLCQRRPDDVLKTLDRFSPDYIQDNWFAGPPTYFAGVAHMLAGRSNAARLAWDLGLTVVETRLKATPQSLDLHGMRGALLALLGRTEEALTEARTVREISRGVDRFHSLHIYALLGRADDAMPIIEQQLGATLTAKNVGWPLTPALLRLDPTWDKIRDDPRFQKLATSDRDQAKAATNVTNGR